MHPTPASESRPRAQRAANLRTALVLAAIALTFFVGVIASKFVGGPAAGMGAVGFAVLLFLAFAIGRNLVRGR